VAAVGGSGDREITNENPHRQRLVVAVVRKSATTTTEEGTCEKPKPKTISPFQFLQSNSRIPSNQIQQKAANIIDHFTVRKKKSMQINIEQKKTTSNIRQSNEHPNSKTNS